MQLFKRANPRLLRRQTLAGESIEERICKHLGLNVSERVLKRIAKKYGTRPSSNERGKLVEAAVRGLENHGAQLRAKLTGAVPQEVSDLRLGFGSHAIRTLRTHALIGGLTTAYSILPDLNWKPVIGRIDDYLLYKISRGLVRWPEKSIGGLEQVREVYEANGENGLENEVALFHHLTSRRVRESMRTHGAVRGFLRAFRDYPLFPLATYRGSGATYLHHQEKGVFFGRTSLVGKLNLGAKISRYSKKLNQAVKERRLV